MTTLSPKQQELYDYIVSFLKEHDYIPTQQYMANTLGVTLSEINNRVRLLEAKGYLKRPARGKIVIHR